MKFTKVSIKRWRVMKMREMSIMKKSWHRRWERWPLYIFSFNLNKYTENVLITLLVFYLYYPYCLWKQLKLMILRFNYYLPKFHCFPTFLLNFSNIGVWSFNIFFSIILKFQQFVFSTFSVITFQFRTLFFQHNFFQQFKVPFFPTFFYVVN